MSSGNVGMFLALPTWNMSVCALVMSFQGGEAVRIWMIVHPTDQMSAFDPCPVCRMTSGAMNCESHNQRELSNRDISTNKTKYREKTDQVEERVLQTAPALHSNLR